MRRSGDGLGRDFRSIAKSLEKHLLEWGKASADEDEDDNSKPKGLPEKKRAKLLNPKHWARDARLVELGYLLRSKIGSEPFSDFNLFKAKAEAALKKEGIKLGAADLKALLRGVSHTAPDAAPVIKKVHKGKRRRYDERAVCSNPLAARM